MLQTRSGTWHLHVDATSCTDALVAWCVRMDLEVANFVGHPEGYAHFAPTRHLTWKTDRDEAYFRDCFELVADRCKAGGNFVGYVEGEYIARVISIPDLPYSETPPPFRVERRQLRIEEGFREGEFHLAFDADASDPRRIQQLLDAGLYGAYELRPNGQKRLVLTMQGYMRDVIPMTEALERFLLRAGGLVDCRLKLERAVASELIGITQVDLPPIADRVIW